jgi:aminopeptidase N
MSLMRFSKDVEYRKQIEEKYTDVDITTVDNDIRWVVASSLLRENNDLSPIYYEIYKNTVDASLKQDMASALVATRSKETILGYLPKLKNGEIRPQDRLGFFYRLSANYAAQDEVIDWMYKNWEWLEKEEGDKTIADYPRYIATVIRTQAAADKYKEFFSAQLEKPALTRDIKVGIADIDSRLELIKKEQAGVFAEINQ